MNKNIKGFFLGLVLVLIAGVVGYTIVSKANKQISSTPNPESSSESVDQAEKPTYKPQDKESSANYPELPVSTVKVTASPLTGASPLKVDFNVLASDSDNTSGIYYTITFGDDGAAGFPRTVNPSITHTFQNSGTYNVIVTRRTQCSSWECLGPSSVVGTFVVIVK